MLTYCKQNVHRFKEEVKVISGQTDIFVALSLTPKILTKPTYEETSTIVLLCVDGLPWSVGARSDHRHDEWRYQGSER
jgi:hypothetical protein